MCKETASCVASIADEATTHITPAPPSKMPMKRPRSRSGPCPNCEPSAKVKRKKVHFAASTMVLGFADPAVDRSMCTVTPLSHEEKLAMLYRVLSRELKRKQKAATVHTTCDTL